MKVHFLNASALYLLAFIPLVASLHFLKLRRKRHVVPSVMFWLEAVEDMKANVPFQRIRSFFPLILQLFFLSLAVVTVARPAFSPPQHPIRTVGSYPRKFSEYAIDGFGEKPF